MVKHRTEFYCDFIDSSIVSERSIDNKETNLYSSYFDLCATIIYTGEIFAGDCFV